MLLKTLPLPAAPHPSCPSRIQPLLHFRLSPGTLPQQLAPSREPARLQEPLRALPRRLLPKLARRGEPRRSLPPPSPPLQQRFLRPRHLPQAHPYSRPLRPPALPPLRRSGSPPDRLCPPSSRLCPESPSTAPASSPRVSPRL